MEEQTFTVAAFDDLLGKYASKALEFQVVHMEASQNKGK